MKWKKGLAAMLFASVTLAACGADEEPAKEDKVVEQQEAVDIDMSQENEQFRAFATQQMTDFIADAELLTSLIREGKLEEAQKLLPIVTMYYERLQPLAASFGDLDEAINPPLTDGEEAKATGFTKLAYGLFTEQKTEGYDAAAKKLVADLKRLEKQLAAVNIAKYNILDGTVQMLNETLNTRLTTNSPADAEVYAVKAQTEVVEELVKIFMTRADATKAAAVIEKTTALNEVLRFYEIGKEDYINYSLFTNTQKQELADAVVAVDEAFQWMVGTVK